MQKNPYLCFSLLDPLIRYCFNCSYAGNRNSASGVLNNVGSNGNCWCSSSNSQNNAYNLNFNSGNVNPQNNNNRANGFSVRAALAFTTHQISYFKITIVIII